MTVHTKELQKNTPKNKIIKFCKDQSIAGEATLDCPILDGHILTILDFLTLK